MVRREIMLYKLLAALILCTILSAGCSPLAAFLATVTPAPTPTPPIDLLADTTCAKPCVLGITPGVTTQSEAWTIVQNNKQLLDCTQHDLTSQGGIRWIECSLDIFKTSSLRIAFPGNTADDVAISPSRLTVEQLIQRYGQPDSVGVLGPLLPDEPPNSTAALNYSNIQATVGLVQKLTEAYEITPSTAVQAVVFLSKAEYAHLAAGIYRPWHGYGVYSP